MRNRLLSSKDPYIAIDSPNPSTEPSIFEIKRSGRSKNPEIDCRSLVINAVLRDRDSTGKEVKSEIRRTLQSGVGDVAVETKDSGVPESSSSADLDDGGCNGDCFGGSGRFPSGGGGDGDGDGDARGRDDGEEEEFGVLLKFDEVMRETEARGASLPSDMLEAAKTVGIRKVLLLRYFDLQVMHSHMTHFPW